MSDVYNDAIRPTTVIAERLKRELAAARAVVEAAEWAIAECRNFGKTIDDWGPGEHKKFWGEVAKGEQALADYDKAVTG